MPMWFDDLTRDIRHGVRGLIRTPGFTAVALLTLALGIGANTAIFSIVNSVVLRPLPYPKPDQLVYLTTQFPLQGFVHFWVSPPEYLEFREFNRSFADVGAYTTSEANVMAGDRPLRVHSALVDEHLLNALGVSTVEGRLFSAGETDVTGPPPAPGQPSQPSPAVAILSYELWRSSFGAQPIVGKTIDIDDRRHIVVGVMAPGADVMDNRTQVWLPLGLNPANRLNRGNHYLFLIGRMKDGVAFASAKRELDGLIGTWASRTGLPPTGHVFAPLVPNANGAMAGHILQMAPLEDEVLGTAGRSVWVLQAAVGLVLLIACANLANLLLARAETRHREFAVRTALGASRTRLLRQSITEGLLLATGGAAIGIWLARVGVQAIVHAYPASLPRTGDITVDLPALMFTAGVALATGIVFGFAPMLHTNVKGLVETLKDGSRGATGAGRRHVRRGLVAGEIALAVVLVAGAVLLVRTVRNLANVDGGFDRGRLVTFSMSLPAVNYPLAGARVEMYGRVLDALRRAPGIQGASAMSGLPPSRPVNANDTDIDNYTPPPNGPFKNVDYYQWVTSDYFETMGIPIVQGRAFEHHDAASTGRVAVVNQTLVNTFWKGLNPIGQRLRPCCGDQVPWYTVVGVAKDVKQGGVDQKTGTEFYIMIDQLAVPGPAPAFVPLTMNVVLRTSLPATALTPTIDRIVADADRTIPVVRLREMEDVFDESIRRPRLLAQLIGGFGGLALLLAAIGVYGVLSYMVAERQREIGIRMALGATRGGVIAYIMAEGLRLAVAGALVGIAATLFLNRLLASLLFGVSATDAGTLAGTIIAVTVIAVLACWLPGWRASRLDPNVVLRDA
ncbi:MAG TPA: ABC transporter permease [Vicinamibacterales bacterium]|jgi:putative ABC transport system permease protein|nr:ABC transporter permease [Vicinamibacterales bacterium]